MEATTGVAMGSPITESAVAGAAKSGQRVAGMLALVRGPVEVSKAGPASEKDGARSRSLANPWEGVSISGMVEPPFDMMGLAMMPEISTELGQCIEAMEVNIAGYGWRLQRHPHALDPSLDAVAGEERERFEDFLLYADYDDRSFTKLRRNTRQDVETTGNGYWEVVRDASKVICAFKHLPSYQMRLMELEIEPVAVVENRPYGRGTRRTFKETRMRKRFRRFVQSRMSSKSDEPMQVFFKQFGDPRDVLWRTGEVVTDEMRKRRKEMGHEIRDDDLATEVVHWKIDSARTPYGVPRFVGNLLSITGTRKSQEINFTTFSNNNVPSMAVLVSDGELTQDSIDRISQFTETVIQGGDNYSRFLILEAVAADNDGAGSSEAPKIEIKPLVASQHTDALFQNYESNNEDRTRRSFRIAPILVGRSDDYTRATADTSRRLTDEQVFSPERADEDWTINRILMGMGMLYHRFVTNSPNVTNDTDLIQVLIGAEKGGGMTPRIARQILEDILNRELPDFSDKVDPDVPFSIQMAEAVKNLALPNEPSQQVAPTMGGMSKALLKMVDGLPELVEPLELASERRTMGKRVIPTGSFEDVAINVGPQAVLLGSGASSALLSSVRLGLPGRNLLVADGTHAHASVKFDAEVHGDLDAVAAAAGLDRDVVEGLANGRLELYAYTVSSVEPLPYPIGYEQPEESLFAKGVITKHLRGFRSDEV